MTRSLPNIVRPTSSSSVHRASKVKSTAPKKIPLTLGVTKTQQSLPVRQPSSSKETIVLPEPTPPKKQRKIEFSDEDEVGQFKSDDTLETWYQASKGV